MIRFTIVLPTTTDRGPLLPLVVRMVQAQSVRDWELFIIGDGVHEATRLTVRELQRQDQRIRFFDHPKHPRRGEVYRHQALSEARGEFVAYLCDRDLWFHDHLAVLGQLLARADLVHTSLLAVLADGRLRPGIRCQLGKRWQRRIIVEHSCPIALSSVAHRLSSYRDLPEGWRTTPPDWKTDHYMWRQFLQQPDLRALSGTHPTLLYFNRGNHPGLATAERLAELTAWMPRMADATVQEALRSRTLQQFATPLNRLRLAALSWLWWRPGVSRVWNDSRWLAPLRRLGRTLSALALRRETDRDREQ